MDRRAVNEFTAEEVRRITAEADAGQRLAEIQRREEVLRQFQPRRRRIFPAPGETEPDSREDVEADMRDAVDPEEAASRAAKPFEEEKGVPYAPLEDDDAASGASSVLDSERADLLDEPALADDDDVADSLDTDIDASELAQTLERRPRAFGPAHWAADAHFDAPGQAHMLVRLSHTEVNPVGRSAAVCLGPAYPTMEYEQRVLGISAGGTGPGTVCRRHFTEQAANQYITLRAIPKYTPTLLCATPERLRDPEYQRKRVDAILRSDGERRRLEAAETNDNVRRDREFAREAFRTPAGTPMPPSPARSQRENHRIAADKVRPTDSPLPLSELQRRAKAHAKEPKVLRASKSDAKSAMRQRLSAKLMERARGDDFTFEDRFRDSTQRFAAVTFISDILRDDPAEQEPVFIWFRTFSDVEGFKAWMEGGAKRMLRLYDIECVDLYSWLHPASRLERDVAATPQVYGNPELQNIMRGAALDQERVKVFEREFKAHHAPAARTSADDAGTPGAGLKAFAGIPEDDMHQAPYMAFDEDAPETPVEIRDSTGLYHTGMTPAQAMAFDPTLPETPAHLAPPLSDFLVSPRPPPPR